MKTIKCVLFLMLMVCYGNISAQSKLSTRLVDGKTSIGIPYASIQNLTTSESTISNENGQFQLKGKETDSIKISSLGYEIYLSVLKDLLGKDEVLLTSGENYLEAISVNAQDESNLGAQKIDQINLKLIPINNAQDLLQTVSGLFIAQHAGGGKAEQIFLRGFDNDHGTDFGVFIDDIPVNLSNHAHGQGYADMHFIIPELIQDAEYYKGLYEAKNGNFVVSGAARYKSINGLDKNSIKLDVGQYGFQRGLVMLNLTPNNRLFSKNKYEKSYFALEGTLNNGFFDAPQNFEKINAFYKYNGQLGNKTALSITGSYFSSSWDASGQIPLRAVNNGLIGWYGAIDDTEGGETARANFSMKLNTFLDKNQKVTHFGYYSNNYYQLFSNFTFFLNDTINGDMIEQNERRNLLGYTFEYERKDIIGKTQLMSTWSAGLRSDNVETKLINSVQRQTIEVKNHNRIQELNAWGYVKEDWKLGSKWTMQLGTRLDWFTFNVQDQLNENKGNRSAYRISPKGSLFFNPKKNVQLFFKAGSGFHSNYAHAAVGDLTISPLPRALAGDIGSEFKIGKKIISSIALWTIKSDAEYVFVADGGEFENNGRSLRYGVDFATKFQPIKSLWLDFSANYSLGQLLDEPENANSIPAAPRFTSTASLIYRSSFGVDAMLSTRYMAKRPLVEDESVIADAYFLVDASVNYTVNKIQVGVSVQNLLNQRWMEAVFYDASKLLDETEPQNDFHFTPGTPFFLKGSITYSF